MEQKDKLYELENALNEFVAQTVEEEFRPEVKVAVAKFFEDEVKHYNEKELAEHCKDAESILAAFRDFLERTQCLTCKV